ncbi:MAG: transcriptional repressor [Candidatus Micrarchaeota archaeon]
MILIINKKMTASRKTRQKQLFEKIIDETKTFFNAQDVYSQALKKDAGIGIATAYRFLNDKVKSGALYSYQCEKRTVYSKNKQHCHFVCAETGEVTHFEIDSLDFLKKRIPGEIISFQIEVMGVCKKHSKAHTFSTRGAR